MTPEQLLEMLREHLEIEVSLSEEHAVAGDGRWYALHTTVTFMGEVVAEHTGDVEIEVPRGGEGR